MPLKSVAITGATPVEIADPPDGERVKLLQLWAQNYEAAPAAANFLILMSGADEIARFPLIASGAPLLIAEGLGPILPSNLFAKDALLNAKLSATGTVWVVIEWASAY